MPPSKQNLGNAKLAPSTLGRRGVPVRSYRNRRSGDFLMGGIPLLSFDFENWSEHWLSNPILMGVRAIINTNTIVVASVAAAAGDIVRKTELIKCCLVCMGSPPAVRKSEFEPKGRVHSDAGEREVQALVSRCASLIGLAEKMLATLLPERTDKSSPARWTAVGDA
jgi:hypothetical protein